VKEFTVSEHILERTVAPSITGSQAQTIAHWLSLHMAQPSITICSTRQYPLLHSSTVYSPGMCAVMTSHSH
jgi:hypothetical protein